VYPVDDLEPEQPLSPDTTLVRRWFTGDEAGFADDDTLMFFVEIGLLDVDVDGPGDPDVQRFLNGGGPQERTAVVPRGDCSNLASGDFCDSGERVLWGQVPEPDAMALIGLALVLLGIATRRRSKRPV
jgi:hypothetical protein